MHTIKITPNLVFEYQCTSGKFIRLPNRINRIGSDNFFCPTWNALIDVCPSAFVTYQVIFYKTLDTNYICKCMVTNSKAAFKIINNSIP